MVYGIDVGTFLNKGKRDFPIIGIAVRDIMQSSIAVAIGGAAIAGIVVPAAAAVDAIRAR